MKRFICVLALASVTALTGCELLKGKKEEDKAEPAQNDQGGGDQTGDQGGGFDATTMVTAPGKVQICPTAKVGYLVEQTMQTAGTAPMVTYFAIVGDAGDAWHVEHVNAGLSSMAASMPDLKGMIMGLVVNKADGTVTKAVLGKPGEKGKEIKIGQVYEAPTQKGPEGTPEDVTIALGTFPAVKVSVADNTSWAGTQGELKGVLLKNAGAGGDYELKAMPKKDDVKAGDATVKVTHLAYTNGTEYWLTQDEVVTCFFPWGEEGKGIFRLKTESVEQAITAVGTSGEAKLAW